MVEEGKKLEIKLNDVVSTRENVGKGVDTLSVERQVILVLLDTKKMLQGAAELYRKLNCKHLAISLEACATHIDEYLAEYERQKGLNK